MAMAKRGLVRDAWSIAKTYWTSEEKWSAWGLLLAVVAFNLGTVCTSVGINAWNRGFYNALQAFDRGEIFRQLGVFFILRWSRHYALGVRRLYATDAANTLETVAHPQISQRLAG